jgi:hypothetical protein
MAGGVKNPVNIFKLGEIKEPKGVLNWRLWFAVFSFGLLGSAHGIDQALITGIFNAPDFQRRIHFDSYGIHEQTDIRGNVSSMVLIGSVGGAMM